MLVASAVMFVCAAAMYEANPRVGCAGMVLFGLGFVFSALFLIPGCYYVEFSPHNFVVCKFFRRTFIPWSEIEFFLAVNFGGLAFLNWRRFPHLRVSGNKRWGRKVAAFDVDGTLQDFYSIKIPELARLLNEELARHSKASPSNVDSDRAHRQ